MKKLLCSHRWLPLAALTLAGALAGYLYYALVGCVTGVCPISSQPHLSTLYGGVIGALLGIVFTPKKKKANPPSS